ncbi:MAG: alpha-L-fucosidase [Planctomycetota bacterium]|jgi:alpha-L-fucosidase
MKPLAIALSLLAAISAPAADNEPKFNRDASLNGYEMPVIDGIPAGYEQYIHASEEDLQWWKDAKLGVFVHWDPSCLSNAEISWNRQGVRSGHSYRPDGVPREEYDSNYLRFNPVNFDADEWLTLVKEAGAKYLVFTTKHHGGFCMFDSAYTDYDIMSSPFARDIAGELVAAAHKHGIKIMWYYSQPDWHHPDHWTENHDRYLEYLHNQLKELTTKYGRIDGIWFDGLGKNGGTWNTPEILKFLRESTPGIIINDRMHSKSEGWGDFHTHEQTVGAFMIDHPWESCISMGGGNWSWLGRDYAVLSHRTSLRMLLGCAGGGGNLLLNTGPRPDGKINPPEADNYRKIGAWLAQHGDSIYATQGGPYQPGPWGVSTHRGSTVYLHIMQQLNDNQLQLPALPSALRSARLLTGGTVTHSSNDTGELFSFSDLPADAVVHTVAVELAEAVPVGTAIVTAPEQSLSHGAEGRSSSENGGKFSVGNLVGKPSKYFSAGKMHKSSWSHKGSDQQPWVEIDLGSDQQISQVVIREYKSQCRKFRLSATSANGTTTVLHEGDYLEEFSLKFAPISVQTVRLEILERERGSIQIKDFDLYR